ncbi:MAG: 3'-5' exonuclease [Proteobacteria bacterium]|nr:3'-5' exonuclease [Pseudomonadota bacterium]
MTMLVFDIETVPDVDGIRRLNGIDATLPDDDVRAWFGQQRRAATGSDFAPPYLQKVVAIACAMRRGDEFRVWSIGDVGDDEATLIRRFFDGIDKLTPQLVSWNGSGFDLPVLHHRALFHGVPAPRYWDWGDTDREFKFNNYLSRFHTRHIDLMDVLAGYQARAAAPLDAVSKLCGFAGKIGIGGAGVAAAVAAGRLAEVRDYCEADVVNTWLVYQRFRLMRGELLPDEYATELQRVRTRIGELAGDHWREFLAQWPPEAPVRP